jgi:hypothetical protein
MSSGNMLMLGSFVNHTFVINDVQGESGLCNGGTIYLSPSFALCKTGFFTDNDCNDLGKQAVDAF